MDTKALRALLSAHRGETVLILGKPETFTFDEIAAILKREFDLESTRTMSDKVGVVIEHRRLNPVESMWSEEAYAARIPSAMLETLEALLAEGLDDKNVLMSLKLSGDEDRVYRLLGNPSLSEALFIALLKMYRWSGEEDDRKDRDVIVYTLRRYLDIKPNETDLLFSPSALRVLARDTRNGALLEALLGFPDLRFVVRRNHTVTLLETIAGNPAIAPSVAQKLHAMKRSDIDRALASNASAPLAILHTLFDRKVSDIDRALASNPRIDETIFEGLLERGDRAVHTFLLWDQPLDIVRYEKMQSYIEDRALFVHLSQNERLDDALKAYLCERCDGELLAAIASNDTFAPEMLARIYARDDGDEIARALALNPNTPHEVLERLYSLIDEDETIARHLAYNKSVSPDVLERLYRVGHTDINEGLAKNPSTPDTVLEALRLEGRYRSQLAENPKLIDAYAKVFEYDGKAI